MSYTVIYKIGTNGEELGECRNAHRGAMYVWNQIAKDYFMLENFPMLDNNKRSEIWNAHDTKPLKDCEKIVLLSTMDKAVISKENKQKLISAFKEYHKSNPSSSLLEQAEIIDDATLTDFDFIAFNQMSVSGFWGYRGYEKEDDLYNYYDPNVGDEHFEIFAN